ncbi:ras guanine nucleotide exchange factor P isoform X2 [Galleria mellonella]|uniref:Ras guanine nucleotide exchange factor P isoform X2 n=1 Tax=Galleria mellonella TaxID=7137 RepID=A0ABM3MA73_GALME|nr:ras guanine nucleotide exchange factor P isoform X2 [Galleria mellonella]
MGSLSADADVNIDMNDSGYVQDATPQKSSSCQTSLLDLSDDVLLYILWYCSPMDLKALGFTCNRLGLLVRDRTLWTRVDARAQPCGADRLRWLLSYALNASTTELLLSGFARETNSSQGLTGATLGWQEWQSTRCPQPDYSLSRTQSMACQRRCHMSYIPSWTPWTKDESMQDESPPNADDSNQEVKPVFTITSIEMDHLKQTCNLTSLALEYCNIDCNRLGLSHFPSTLKKLSLRGTKCFNQRVDKTFLFRISDFLPHLEHLDVSECQWMEPVSLMTLSKMARLESLHMRDCRRLSEFVAYASLSMRYGFRKLKSLDVRGSPLGNSEVTALGWLPALQQLRLAAPAAAAASPPATSSPAPPLQPWERHVPEYFKTGMKLSDSETVSAQTNVSTMTENNINEDSQNKSDHSDEERDRQNKTEREASKRKNEKGDTQDRPESSKRQKRDPNTSSSSKYTNSSDSDSDNDDNDQSNCVLIKKFKLNGVNFSKATTIKHNTDSENGEQPSTSNCQNASTDSKPKLESYVRFRQNEAPVFINCQLFNNENRNGNANSNVNNDISNNGNSNANSNSNSHGNNSNNEINNASNENSDNNNENINGDNENANNEYRDFENRINDGPPYRIVQYNPQDPLHRIPRAHIVYVNVREQRHNVCRLTIPNEAPNAHEPRYCVTRLPPTRESDPSTLVTDIAVQHFGRAEGEDVSYFRIGPPGPELMGRPNVSNLRELTINGYRNITDRSLVHLATAAPHLRRIDFRGTRVTQRGVDDFKSLRPDVEIVFSEFVEKE